MTITSAKALQTLAQQNPAAAKQWLSNVASHSEGALPAAQIDQLQKLAALKPDEFVKTLEGNPSLVSLFAATKVAGLGGDPSLDLPVIHGTLTVDRGTKVVAGEQGYREWPDLKLTLTTEDGRKLALESDANNRQEIFQFVPGTDVMAFAGKQVSIRGHLDESGKTVRVTEFAPGNAKDFTTGRVLVQGNQVLVRTRGRGFVEVTDPKLKAELGAHNNLGVILTGETKETVQKDGTIKRSFDANPESYWMLVRFTEAPSPIAGGLVSGPIQAATSTTSTNVQLSPEAAKNIEVNDRMYVQGRFDGAVIDASDATTSAGSPWTVAKSTRAAAMKSVIDFTETPTV